MSSPHNTHHTQSDFHKFMNVEMGEGEGRKEEKGVGVRYVELAVKVGAVKQELNQIKELECLLPSMTGVTAAFLDSRQDLGL